MIKRLLFMRHGESMANAAGVYAGARADVPLTAKGMKQAQTAGLDLRDAGVEIIIASPLDRAQSTAKIVAEEIGYAQNLITTDARLHEIDVGHLTGQHDQGFVHGYEYLAAGTDNTAETPAEIKERVASFMADMASKYNDSVVLIVAHAGVARMFQALLTGVTLASLSHTNIPNAEPFELPLDRLGEVQP